MFARFLSAITGIDKEALLNAEYTGGDIIKSKLTERGKIADIIVKVDSARQIVVEMNKFDPGNNFEKNASYAFSLFNENTKIGKRMWLKIILINIDNFNRFGTDLPILDFKIRDKTGKYEVDIFHSYNIVLTNLKNPNYNIDKEVTKYLEFITSKEFSKLKMIAEGDEDGEINLKAKNTELAISAVFDLLRNFLLPSLLSVPSSLRYSFLT